MHCLMMMIMMMIDVYLLFTHARLGNNNKLQRMKRNAGGWTTVTEIWNAVHTTATRHRQACSNPIQSGNERQPSTIDRMPS